MGSNLAIVLVCLVASAAGKTWPTDNTAKCTWKNKQKAMVGKMDWSPSLMDKPFTSLEVTTGWNALEFNPTLNPSKKGGVYIAYQFALKSGLHGYLGVQMHATKGQFIFSLWDKDRFDIIGEIKRPKQASLLTWPVDMTNCKRNCQDCGIQGGFDPGLLGEANKQLKQMKKDGLTTGTQCSVKYDQMKVGDKYRIELKQRVKNGSIDTTNFGGMPQVHKDRLNEQDKTIVGSIWDVYAYDLQRNNKKIVVGSMIWEGSSEGIKSLRTFDEIIGCYTCDMIYHKDTRYGLKLGAEDGTIRRPTTMKGNTKSNKSTCKKYSITGSKTEESITFEGGPFVKTPYKKYPQSVW